jgi:hypothetical protein
MRLQLLILSVVWVATTASGFGLLWSYGYTPGNPANPLPSWPSDSRIPRKPGRSVLVMFAHPHCPCTRASVGELAWILARVPDRVSPYVVFVKPSGAAEGWEKTDLWQSVLGTPGVRALRDDDGREARLFDAKTSGQTFLYDEAGQLSFSGGVTGARGHPGDNAGRASVIGILNHQEYVTRKTSAFGCPLFSEACQYCKVSK